MSSPFSYIELKKPSFFQKITGSRLRENAINEINNLLSTKSILEIDSTEILQIADKYNINFVKEFSDRFIEFYEVYLKQCLKDSLLSEVEIQELNHLKNLLALTDPEVSNLHNRISGDIYKKNYEDVIKDGEISEAERYFLDKIQSNVVLPFEVVNKISGDARDLYLQSQFKEITSDEKISPTEWEEAEKIAKNLNAQLSFNGDSKMQLEKYKLYWLIENGELPEKQVELNLPENEICFFSINADWLELRTVNKGYNYGGIGYRIKIMKGVYYRMGNINLKKITSEELQVIDTGTVYLTNKRIIFTGSRKNTNIKLNKILSITPYSDGVGIEKDTGKSPIIRVSFNADILTRTLGRMINDC